MTNPSGAELIAQEEGFAEEVPDQAVTVEEPTEPQPWRECPNCEGEGETEGGHTCPVCKGAGGFGQSAAEIKLKKELAKVNAARHELAQNYEALEIAHRDAVEELNAYYEKHGPLEDDE